MPVIWVSIRVHSGCQGKRQTDGDSGQMFKKAAQYCGQDCQRESCENTACNGQRQQFYIDFSGSAGLVPVLIPYITYYIPYTLYIPHTTAKQIQNAVIGQGCRHGGGRILRERVAGGVGNSGGEEAVLAPAADIMLPCEFFL